MSLNLVWLVFNIFFNLVFTLFLAECLCLVSVPNKQYLLLSWLIFFMMAILSAWGGVGQAQPLTQFCSVGFFTMNGALVRMYESNVPSHLLDLLRFANKSFTKQKPTEENCISDQTWGGGWRSRGVPLDSSVFFRGRKMIILLCLFWWVSSFSMPYCMRIWCLFVYFWNNLRPKYVLNCLNINVVIISDVNMSRLIFIGILFALKAGKYYNKRMIEVGPLWYTPIYTSVSM